MQEPEVFSEQAPVGGGFTEATVLLNQSVNRLRMLSDKLGANFALIDSVYQKVTLGGMARECSAMVSQVQLELEVLQGLCWSAINLECEVGLQLSFEDWSTLGSAPPPWFREVFESAVLLNGMPDEASLEKIALGDQVLVIRASDRRGDGLLQNVAALMPAGFGVASTQVWWPWMMGSVVPVVLQATDRKNVLEEVSAASFLAAQFVVQPDGP